MAGNLETKYEGPYQVKKLTLEGAYFLKGMIWMIKEIRLNSCHLKEYYFYDPCLGLKHDTCLYIIVWKWKNLKRIKSWANHINQE